MSTKTLPGGTRRWFTGAALLTLLVMTASGCYGTWGIRESYRAYAGNPVNGGGIATEGGVTWLDGTGAAKGPFQWTVSSAAVDPVTETGFIQFSGGVHTKAHAFAGGYLMEFSLWNPRLEVNGDVGTLEVDLNYRPFEGFAPATLPALQAALDVPFATVDLSGADWTIVNGAQALSNAPMTGVASTMALIGWDQFYPTPVVLDPLSTSFNTAMFAPGLVSLPRLSVSKTTGLHVGDQIIVSGTGFAPTSGNGTRPPLSGQPAGSYVILGKFAATWQPSVSAPSSSRTVLSQKWALPATSFAFMNTNFPNPGAYVLVDQYGSFETTVTVADSAAAGNLGIYSYPGSGAVNANYEIAVPLTLAP